MSERVNQILEDALQLPPFERATVVEKLLASLDRPDARIDELWAQEAEARVAAFDAGRLKAYDAEEVFAELNLS
jgi:putative addiction module component (TIGR02574 family)